MAPQRSQSLEETLQDSSRSQFDRQCSALNWEPHPTNDWFVLIWGVIHYHTFHHICHSKSFQRCETRHQASKHAWTRMQITKQKSQKFALAYVYRTLSLCSIFYMVPVWIGRVAIPLALAFCVLACNPVPCGLHRTIQGAWPLWHLQRSDLVLHHMQQQKHSKTIDHRTTTATLLHSMTTAARFDAKTMKTVSWLIPWTVF